MSVKLRVVSRCVSIRQNAGLRIQRLKTWYKKTRVPETRGSHDFRTVLPSLVQQTSAATGLAIGEVKEPPAVIPFEADLSPSHWYLRVRVEWADVRPCRRAVLLWIGQCSIVWVGCVARPSIIGHVWRIVPWSTDGCVRSHWNWLPSHGCGSTSWHRSYRGRLGSVRCRHHR